MTRIVTAILRAFVVIAFSAWLGMSMPKPKPQTDNVCGPGLVPVSRTIVQPNGSLWTPVCADPGSQTIFFNGTISGYTGTLTHNSTVKK